MARLDPNYIWENRLNYPKRRKDLDPFDISDFITNSATNKKMSHYDFYNSVWVSPLISSENSFRYKLRNVWWWQPRQDSIPAQFLESSSMHGLKYISQPRRHIIERIFWLIAFTACMTGAVFMILAIWRRYHQNPVIVTFNPAEQDLDSLPFPAVTICNVNPIKKSTVEEYIKKFKQGKTEAERDYALDALRVINGICLTQESYLQTLQFASARGQLPPEARFNPSPEMEKNLTTFLHQNSQPCRELLRYCVWGQLMMECEKLFKPIITDYGKCCTFNMLPQELMETYGSVTQNPQGNSSSAKRFEWSPRDIEEWRKWDYDTNGYILEQDLKFPYRQRRAGVTDGLSLLLDADIDNNFCPSSDSEGLKILYHLPLDAPRVADLGSIIGVNREVFLEVNPDLTIADPAIESYDRETRKCYFGLEKKLQFYRPYTRSNCMEECWTNILMENCSCVLYYAPRNASTPICSTTPGTPDDTCVKDNERRYLGRLHRICNHCEYSCNDLTYNGQITSAQLQSGDILYTLPNNQTRPDWTYHKLTVFHVFMGSDSTVPKLRSKLYQAVDLIANTGGLLGLSIGFSVLSAVEIIYFATLRIFCQQLRKSEKFGEQNSRDSTITDSIKGNTTKPSNFIVTGGNSDLKGFNNGLSLLDNSNFLHEINKRNLGKM